MSRRSSQTPSSVEFCVDDRTCHEALYPTGAVNGDSDDYDDVKDSLAIGEIVALRADHSRAGPIIAELEPVGGHRRFRVYHSASQVRDYFEDQIEPAVVEVPRDEWIRRVLEERFVSHSEFRARLMATRLNNPQVDHIYALRAARIQHIPFQFKPLLRLLRADQPRLLIADDVGVGKTIEAGLILKELSSRQQLDRVLALCPKALTTKWRAEMRRFDESFRTLSAETLRYCLDEADLECEWPEEYARSIVHYELFRREPYLVGHDVGRRHRSGLLEPDSGVDVSLWDLAGQIAGRPVAALLGGTPRGAVPVYASWIGPWRVEMLTEGALGAGFVAAKLKVGFGSRTDRLTVERARSVSGDSLRLFADANRAWSMPEAEEMCRLLADYGVEWCEEPLCDDAPERFDELFEATGMPLATGENLYGLADTEHYLGCAGVAHVQPDVSKTGGITHGRDVSVLADGAVRRSASLLWERRDGARLRSCGGGVWRSSLAGARHSGQSPAKRSARRPAAGGGGHAGSAVRARAGVQLDEAALAALAALEVGSYEFLGRSAASPKRGRITETEPHHEIERASHDAMQ